MKETTVVGMNADDRREHAQFASEFVDMIVERYRATGAPMIELGGAMVFFAARLMAEDGVGYDEIAATFDAMADLARAVAEGQADLLPN